MTRGSCQTPGSIVIDEQHKFGVAQRAAARAGRCHPDVLVMTATPIPRTLTLTIYGDLEVSTIDQKPRDGVKIITKVRPKTKLKDAAKFLREQIEEGRQGYHRVSADRRIGEDRRRAAATKGHEEWSKLLAPCEVGLLHGRMQRGGEGGRDEALPRGQAGCARFHDGDRSGHRCAERDRDVHSRRGALRFGAASSVARPDRARRTHQLLRAVCG